jgi:hypothetical protein
MDQSALQGHEADGTKEALISGHLWTLRLVLATNGVEWQTHVRLVASG